MAIHPPLDETGLPFTGENIGTAFTKLLESFPRKPRLLGFGEPTHGLEALPQLRNALFRHLVEHEGYRSITIESDCLLGLRVDRFVTEGAGSLDDAMRHGFSHGFGESAANRELVGWLREYNRDRAEADQVRFFGFDGPLEITAAASPGPALLALHDYLATHVDSGLLPSGDIALLLGDEAQWTNPDAAMDPAQSVGAADEVKTLRLIADDLRALLTAQAPHLVSVTSRDEWWRASLHGRTAAGLLRYHTWMADTSASRVGRLMGERDAMMSDNLFAILEREAHRGPTLAFAHNGHLQRDKGRWQMGDIALEWWSAGAIAGTRLGDEYAFVAMAMGEVPEMGIGVPPSDTLEGVLHTLPQNRYVLDSAGLATALHETKLLVRTDIDYRYIPFDPEHLENTDGVVFVKHIPAT
jgi:erythromycin esterase-like protein